MFCFFAMWDFFHEHSQFKGQQDKGEPIPLLLSSTSTRFIEIASNKLMQWLSDIKMKAHPE